jgi:hypothetical protein
MAAWRHSMSACEIRTAIRARRPQVVCSIVRRAVGLDRVCSRPLSCGRSTRRHPIMFAGLCGIAIAICGIASLS